MLWVILMVNMSDVVYRYSQTYKVLKTVVVISVLGIIIELIFAYLSSSIIIYTDAIHWIVDTSLEFISMITFYIVSKVYRKIKWNIFALEALLVLVLSLTIFSFYILTLIETIKSYTESLFAPTTTNPFLALVTLFSGVLTILMYIVERRAYQKLKTEILKVDMTHAIIDLSVALVASIGIVLTAYTHNFIVELVVVLFVLFVALQTLIELCKEAIKSILGFEVDPNLKALLTSRLSKFNREDIKIGEIELRKMGTFYVAKVIVYLDPRITIGEAHKLRKFINIESREVSDLIHHVDVIFYPMKKYAYYRKKEKYRK